MASDASISGSSKMVAAVGGTGFVRSGVEVGMRGVRCQPFVCVKQSEEKAALEKSILGYSVGFIGTDSEKLDKRNGDANCDALSSASRKTKRAEFVSVGYEVMVCEEGWPAFSKGTLMVKEWPKDVLWMRSMVTDAHLFRQTIF
eukprot:scaffold3084_cov144-Cylindrotheca_fusiformis.AAC.68